MATVDQRLLTLLDIEDIRQLRMRYSHLLDSGDVAGLGQVFTTDATVSVTVGTMKGLPAIKAGLADAFRQFDRDARGSYPFVHAITNHQVTLTGSDSATGRCYLIDFETASKPDPNPLLLLGLYNDFYRRIDGEWLISESTLEVVWPPSAAGDADDHH